MSPSFVLVLKSERCIDVCKLNRQLSFLVKRDNKISNLKVKASEAWLITQQKRNSLPFTKFKSQIILLTKKNRLNVILFRFHITINYKFISTLLLIPCCCANFYKK